MKILTAQEIKKLDRISIEKEGISSFELMNRAAKVFFHWMMENNHKRLDHLTIIVGPGNNGGDGLVVARLSISFFNKVSIYVVNQSNQFSEDFAYQLEKIPPKADIYYIKNKEDIKLIQLNRSLVIDALFGSGLNREVSGFYAEVIEYLNNSNRPIFSIDVPSGLFIDDINLGNNIIKATKTCTFEIPKLSFFFIENYVYTGDWDIVSIGLDPEFIQSIKASYNLLDRAFIHNLIKPRKPFHHKGSFGHVILFAGSEGMTGAAVLAAKASLKAGAGKTTVIIPDMCSDIVQVSIPEAMIQKGHGRSVLIDFSVDSEVQAIGIGPGIGKNIKTKRALVDFLESQPQTPIILDADALNIIAEKQILALIPPQSIITPHPGEYIRLFGDTKNSADRIENQISNSKKYNIYIVYKGAYTTISSPEGNIYFNNTGNPGMATAGSGDVLTGIITSLVAQNYTPLEACQIGVFMHGYAGDIAATFSGYIGLIASDLINYLPKAFKDLDQNYYS